MSAEQRHDGIVRDVAERDEADTQRSTMLPLVSLCLLQLSRTDDLLLDEHLAYGLRFHHSVLVEAERASTNRLLEADPTREAPTALTTAPPAGHVSVHIDARRQRETDAQGPNGPFGAGVGRKVHASTPANREPICQPLLGAYSDVTSVTTDGLQTVEIDVPSNPQPSGSLTERPART